MAKSTSSRPYLRTKILTASPVELMVIMHNAAIGYCDRAREKMLSQKFDESCDLIVRAENVLMELSSGLRREVYPELVDNLTRLYEFVFHRLFESNCSRDPQKLTEVTDVLTVLRNTWVNVTGKELNVDSTQTPPGGSAGLELSA